MSTNEVIEAPRPERRDVTPLAVQTALTTVGMTSCPELSKALAAARDRCKKVIKDREVKFPGTHYRYASADAVIEAASDALETSGLALLPIREELVVITAGNAAFYALNRLLVLSHQSGEFTPLEIRGWPVIPDKGRPLDKAYAIALTSSLSYKLRDLLQMPRGDSDDMTTRDDRATPVQAQPTSNGTRSEGTPVAQGNTQEAPPANPTPAPQSPPETLTEQEEAGLVSIARTNKRTPDDAKRILSLLQVPTLKKAPRSALPWLERVLTNGLVTTETVERISGLVNQLQIPWEKVRDRLQQLYQVSLVAMLTPHQAAEMENLLKARLEAQVKQLQAELKQAVASATGAA